MIILILAGLFALIFGKIAVTRRLALHGKFARLFGVALIILAIPLAMLVSGVFSFLLPSALLENKVLIRILDLIILISAAVGLVYPFKRWQDRSEESRGKPQNTKME
jgi:hypothetical protein